MKGIPFTKMSGAGNDFIVLEREVWESIPGDKAAWVRAVTRRGLSVGSDGVLVVDRPRDGMVAVCFLNPDAGAAFCGNGSRCAARFAKERLGAPPAMALETAAGEIQARVDGGRVRLTLPPPTDLGERSLEASGAIHAGRLVVVGVPHVVLFVPDAGAYPLEASAPLLRRHPSLGPAGANVDVVSRDGDGRLRIRTWERGVENETLSCGSGAVAAAYAARLAGGPEEQDVLPASGILLRVKIAGEPAAPRHAELTGDARFVFDGVLSPEGIAGAL